MGGILDNAGLQAVGAADPYGQWQGYGLRNQEALLNEQKLKQNEMALAEAKRLSERKQRLVPFKALTGEMPGTTDSEGSPFPNLNSLQGTFLLNRLQGVTNANGEPVLKSIGGEPYITEEDVEWGYDLIGKDINTQKQLAELKAIGDNQLIDVANQKVKKILEKTPDANKEAIDSPAGPVPNPNHVEYKKAVDEVNRLLNERNRIEKAKKGMLDESKQTEWKPQSKEEAIEFERAKKDGVTKPTATIQEYELAKEQGYKGSFVDYQLALKKAGASNVTVDNKAITEEAKAIGKVRGKIYEDIYEAGKNAEMSNMSLDEFDQYLENITTGKLMPTITDIAQYAQTFGIEVDQKWNEAQALDAVSKRFALSFRNPAGGSGMPGNFSDQDRKYLEAIAPGLGKSNETNKLIIDAMRKVNNRRLETQSMADEWYDSYGTMKGFGKYIKGYAEANPLFGQTGKDKPKAGATSSGNRFTVKETKK